MGTDSVDFADFQYSSQLQSRSFLSSKMKIPIFLIMLSGVVVYGKIKCSSNKPCGLYEGTCSNDNQCKDFLFCGTQSCDGRKCCTDGWYTDYSGEIEIKRGNLLTTFKKMGKSWVVYFKLKLNSVNSGRYLSILQMTTANGNKEKNYGSRNPAVFIKGNKLHIAAAINGNSNHHYDVPKALEAGKWYDINIQQADYDVEGGYKGTIYTIKVDGEEVYKIDNDQPKIFENVKLYVGAPFSYQPADGRIKELSVTSYRRTAKGAIIV